MKRTIAMVAWMLCVSSSAGAALKCPKTLSSLDRVVALQSVANLMGRYSHLAQMRGEPTLGELFALKTHGVSWKKPQGKVGPQNLAAEFERMKVQNFNPPGMIHIHSMLTPVIEIAEDGQTAKGVWDSFGPGANNGNDAGVVAWLKYAVDFVREDGDWKIWHMQVYPVFNTSWAKSITETARERRAAAANGGGQRGGAAGGPGAGQGASPNERAANSYWQYDGVSSMIGTGPFMPVPYCTFDSKTAY
jgi:hypothetical protein